MKKGWIQFGNIYIKLDAVVSVTFNDVETYVYIADCNFEHVYTFNNAVYKEGIKQLKQYLELED